MPAWIETALNLHNIYDYAEFAASCAAAGREPLPFPEYAQKVEALLTARREYPAMEPADAYMKLIADQKGHLVAVKPSAPAAQAPCGSCGGGKVR